MKKASVSGARKQQHPEIMTGGVYGPLLYAAIRRCFPDGVKSSGQVEQLLHSLNDRAGVHVDPYDTAQGALAHAIIAWEDSGKPMYFLEEELAKVLMHTEIPMEVFDLSVDIPDNGMYVVLPPLFSLENSGHQHPVEGFYLVKDVIAVPTTGGGKADFSDAMVGKSQADRRRVVSIDSPDYLTVQGISCIGVGRPKGTMLGRMREERDDALVVFHLCPQIPLKGAPTAFGGIDELERVVVNLLYALKNTTSVVAERRQPVLSDKEVKRRPAKQERLLQETGRTVNAFTVLSLSKTVRSARPSSSGADNDVASERKLKHPKYVSGHFHRYWVLSPKGEKVLGEKEGRGGKLYLVEHLLAPYLQGVDLPPPATKTVIVKR